MNNNTVYHLINPIKLIPTEEINDHSARILMQKIVDDGRWTTPIIIHECDLFVMDGHHRLDVAGRLGLKLVPVLLSNYDRIDVTAWRSGEIVTAESIFAMVRSGRKFPYKTTRHLLREASPSCDIPLIELMQPQAEFTPYPPMPNSLAFARHSI